jgi:hypothetical protein
MHNPVLSMPCPVSFSSHVYANNILGTGEPRSQDEELSVLYISAINWNSPLRESILLFWFYPQSRNLHSQTTEFIMLVIWLADLKNKYILLANVYALRSYDLHVQAPY